MCGIAGILKFNQNKIALEDLRKMTDAVIHRGPDGEGHWLSEKENVGFGHRRLSIIDLSENGKQPMHYKEDRYTITFNGEIYNYIELKQELAKKGYQFVSDSDTEVLLALYDLKKEGCLEDLDGMFSFAIWDNHEQSLFCARDRFGEKPFHYYLDSQQFVFASEIKQFWAYGISKKINQRHFNLFIKEGFVDDTENPEQTFYENIKRLDAGHYLIINASGVQKPMKYWDINLRSEKFTGNIQEAAEEFLRLFTQSIKLRLRSDVPLGTSLSGGLDSSSICLIVDRLKQIGQKQTTFSARFKDFEQDEGKYIEEVKNACKNIEAHYIWPNETYFLDNIKKISYHQDEPFGSSSIVAQYSVMELAKKNNTTVLIDGQGADEYLAGYKPYYHLYLNQLFYNNKKKFHSESASFNTLHQGVSNFQSPNTKETLQMKLGRYRRVILKQPMPYSSNVLQEKLYSDTMSHGLKTLLRYADRNSMAHSREVRLPFLSHKLVEFVFSLPDEYKLNSGWTKFVLRKAMASILPTSICWRVDKVGYEAPQDKWLKHPLILNEIERYSKQFHLFTEGPFSQITEQQKWRILVNAQFI